MTDINKVELAFTDFMKALDLDLEDGSLKDTPKRVAKMFIQETCCGLYEQPPKITVFDNVENYGWIVLVKDIEVKSLCEHHFQPFIGHCHIAYIPSKKIIGLSKFSRIVRHFARRPQVQEKLIKQIHKFLCETLETKDVAVVMKCEHFCMKLRWVEEWCANTVTSVVTWLFMHSEKTRTEFYDLLKV